MTSVLPISPSCKSGPNSGCEDYLSKRSNGPGGLRLGCFGVVKMPPVKPGMANRFEVSPPRSVNIWTAASGKLPFLLAINSD